MTSRMTIIYGRKTWSGAWRRLETMIFCGTNRSLNRVVESDSSD